MRRGILSVLLCTILLLCGCSGEESAVSPAVEFRAALVQAGSCSFRAEIEADLGESVESFTVDCTAKPDGTTELTLVEPETLAGITAAVSERGGKITYDGMAVDFGLLANGMVIPAAAPALAVCCWGTEYIASAGEDGEAYRVTYEKDYDEKMLLVDTWYKNEVPISAEVCYNQERILRMTISEFSLN